MYAIIETGGKQYKVSEGDVIRVEKLAVEAGYWFNFRFNPQLAKEGKDAFSLDSKAPTGSYQDFLKGENRYAALAKFNPNKAAKLFAESEEESKEHYKYLTKMVDLYKAE